MIALPSTVLGSGLIWNALRQSIECSREFTILKGVQTNHSAAEESLYFAFIYFLNHIITLEWKRLDFDFV